MGSLPPGVPVSLDHRQATALARDLYWAWADGRAFRTTAVLHTAAGWVPDQCWPQEQAAGFAAANARLGAAIERGEGADFEPLLGRLVDRLLLARAIPDVTADSRALLLDAFALALQDAF